MKFISCVQKSSFLLDLRLFLMVFFVWTENKGSFTVTKRLQRRIPVALNPINYDKFLVIFEMDLFCIHFFASKHYSLFVQQVEFSRCFVSLRLYTWLHCSEFPQCTGNFARQGIPLSWNYCKRKELFTNNLWTNTCNFVFFSSVRKW